MLFNSYEFLFGFLPLVLGVFMLLIPSVMYAFTLGLNKLVEFAAFLKRKWKLLKEDGKQ